MKILRWVSVVLISVGGLATIIAFGAIMDGISNSAVYDVTLTIGKVSGMITIIGLLCGSIRAIALLSAKNKKLTDTEKE